MTNTQKIRQALLELFDEVEQSPEQLDVTFLLQTSEFLRTHRIRGVQLAFDTMRKLMGVASLRMSKEGKNYSAISALIDATTALQAEVEGEC